jgi:hypothetical protein
VPIEDKVMRYTVWVAQTSYATYTRTIRLSLESGGDAFIAFPAVRPVNWLQISGSSTNLYLTADEFSDVYRIVQTESPVYFTAGDFFGLLVGAVHTQLDLDQGEPPGEGDTDAQHLVAVVRRARAQPGATTTSSRFE